MNLRKRTQQVSREHTDHVIADLFDRILQLRSTTPFLDKRYAGLIRALRGMELTDRGVYECMLYTIGKMSEEGGKLMEVHDDYCDQDSVPPEIARRHNE